MSKAGKLTVIGGGIAGLSAAYYALQEARKHQVDIQISVLDKAGYWGGKIITERVDGFVVEGGPDTFIITKPWGMQLCRELGLDDRLHGTNPENADTFVLHEGELEPLPEGLTMMVPSRFMPMIRTDLLSWPDKLRMGLDFLIPPADPHGDETLGNFVTRRLGRAAYENLIEPLMSGIYAGDGDELSLLSTFPYLRELEQEHGGLIKGALAVRRKRAEVRRQRSNNGRSSGIFRTSTTGLAEITEALVVALKKGGVQLMTGMKVNSLTRERSHYQLNVEGGIELKTDGVILATPAFITGDIVEEEDPDLAQTLQDIPYVSTATVSLAYPEQSLPGPLNGRGYVIPREEDREALACTWTSSKFPHRAPDDHALLRVFIGRAGQEEDISWTEGYLLDVARREVASTLSINIEPDLSRVYVWENAMPQYNLGHQKRLEDINQALQSFSGLALAGNGYRWIGIPDCIHSGQQAARQVIEELCL